MGVYTPIELSEIRVQRVYGIKRVAGPRLDKEHWNIAWLKMPDPSQFPHHRTEGLGDDGTHLRQPGTCTHTTHDDTLRQSYEI